LQNKLMKTIDHIQQLVMGVGYPTEEVPAATNFASQAFQPNLWHGGS
jgi:hypothetical protein